MYPAAVVTLGFSNRTAPVSLGAWQPLQGLASLVLFMVHCLQFLEVKRSTGLYRAQPCSSSHLQVASWPELARACKT